MDIVKGRGDGRLNGKWIVYKEVIPNEERIYTFGTKFTYKIIGYRCSVCGKIKQNNGMYLEMPAVCPNCGAPCKAFDIVRCGY